MEKFEIDGEKKLELFTSFVGKAKSVFLVLIDNIKKNIADYEFKIEGTAKEISDNEISREKCEQEISKMEDQIATIKDTIENVESTYKKIADAYSSTSKGDTKELYSGIIDGAKENCDKEVEKNRSEIAKLNSDIEAIKNNISEFTKTIDGLNKDLENYSNELYRYNKGLEYYERISGEAGKELDEIAKMTDEPVKKEAKPKKGEQKKNPAKKPSIDDKKKEEPKAKPAKKPSVLDTFETESFDTKKKEEKKPVLVKKEEAPKNGYDFEESLRQIYELTGYTPKEEKKSEVVEEVKTEPKVVEEPKEQPVYTDNLENLFSTPSANIVENKKETKEESFFDTEFSSWENMLNASNDSLKEEPKPVESVEPVKSIANELVDTTDQLLMPYGTSMARLKALVAKEIVYKNGNRVPFELDSQDVIKAINAIDGNDLKKMKTVGPEITLLRKMKEMKEGSRL